MPLISLLTPTWRSAWYLATFARSAFRHATEAKVEVLVFSQEHDGATELAVAKLRSEGVPIRLVGRSPSNEGVAFAVNACLMEAKGDFCFYSGDDNYLLPRWDAALLARLRPGESQYLTARSIEPTGSNPCMYAPHDFGRCSQDFREQALLDFWKDLPKRDGVSHYTPTFLPTETWKRLGGYDLGYWPGFGTDPDFAMSFYADARDRGQEPAFLAVGDCGAYHFQCVGTARVRSAGATLASHQRFRDKWGCSMQEFVASIGSA